MHTAKTNFNGGLLSAQVDMRSDAAAYASGCRILDNFVPRIAGGISKRAGTRFYDHTTNDEPAALIPFNYSTDVRYLIQLREGALRVRKNGVVQMVHTLADAPPPTWNATQVLYAAGDWVYRDGTVSGVRDTYFFSASAAHLATSSPDNGPPSANWTSSYVPLWVSGTSYAVGALVQSGANHYACITANSDTSFTPAKWTQLNVGRVSKWQPATSYAVGDIVEYLGKTYFCSQANTGEMPFNTFYFVNLYSGSWVSGTGYTTWMCVQYTYNNKNRFFRTKNYSHTSTVPPINSSGVVDTANWVETTTPETHSTASIVYYPGVFVKIGTNIFVCKAAHVSSSSNTPIVAGGSAYWYLLPGFKPYAAGAKVPGDNTVYGRAFLSCKTAYTAVFPDTMYNIQQKNEAVGFDAFFYQRSSIWSSTRTYLVGDAVAYNSVGYVCIQEHSANTSQTPGTTGGAGYWQVVQNWVPVWGSGVNYLAGQYVVGYRVVSSYTSGASLAADVAAGYLVYDGGVPFSVATPYSLEELAEVNPVEVNDLIWLFHPNHETRLLQRLSDAAWKYSTVPWDYPPMRDENTDETLTLTPSATSGSITVTANRGIFQLGHVGGYFAIGHRRDSATSKLNIISANEGTASTPLRLVGRWDLFIFGTTWKGEISLQTSKDGVSNWKTLRTWNQPVANMRTITTFGTATEETYYRLFLLDWIAGTTDNYAIIEAADSRITGVVKIDRIVSATVAEATVVRSLWAATATDLWAEGAYSDFRGWPRAGTLHELRMFMAGGASEPQTLRASRTDDFFSFEDSSNDNGALSLTIASKESNVIQWIESVNGALIAATIGEVWSADSGTDSKGMTPTNPPRIKMQSKSGSSTIWGKLLGDSLVYLQRDKKTLREFVYSFDRNKFVAPSLIALADDITRTGVKRMVAVQQPEPTLYCVLKDGRLLSLTFDKDQSVTAWAEHKTDGYFEDAAGLYGGEEVADEVWFIVKRVIGGQTYRFIEAFDPLTLKGAPYETPNALCYLDAAVDATVVTTAGQATKLTGVDHLYGKSVMALVDGKVRGPLTIDNTSPKSISLGVDEVVTSAIVGLPFTAQVQGMKLELQTQEGSMQGMRQRLNSAHVRTYESNGAEHCSNPDDSTIPWSAEDMGNVTDVAQRQVDPKDFKLDTASRYEKEINLSIRSSLPLPLNILGIVYDFEYSDHS